jgi:Tfp pilus assembly protein PilP
MQKLISQSLILSILTGIGAAQAKPVPKTPASQTVQKAAPPAKPSPVVPAAKTGKPAASPAKPVAKTPAKPAVPKAAAPKPAVAATSKPAAAPKPAVTAEAKPAPPAAAANARPRRDPFVSPVRLQDEKMRSNPACTTGARCLVINQVVLKGVVKTPGGMIAMVENSAKKQYNLREKDPVQSGFVLKITSDSIVFRENVTDMLGNSTTREVVKRVTVPAV